MFPKEKDIPYAGVNPQRIKEAKPEVNLEMLKRYAYYQKERTNIYVKKEILKENAPWTDNDMLRNFKFTMTKRYLDRESKNLIDNILNRDDVSYCNKLLNCVAFRLINRFYPVWDILEDKYIDFSSNQEEWDAFQEEYKLRAIKYFNVQKLEDIVGGLMSDAYYTSSFIRVINARKRTLNNTPDKKYTHIENIINIFDHIYCMQDEFLKAKDIDNPYDMLEQITAVPAVGEFVAYQIFSDWSYIKEFPFSDKEVCMAGPGTIRGIDHLFDNKGGLDYVELVFWVKDNIERLCEENDLEWDLDSWFYFLQPEQRYWGCGDICNSFCEFDKSTRIWDQQLMKENGKRVRKFKSEVKYEDW